jgi:hypothetical protein
MLQAFRTCDYSMDFPSQRGNKSIAGAVFIESADI